MYISDGIIREKLKNVYFIWGRGKTTIANRLSEKYDFYIYKTDESRDRQMLVANPVDQPYMCRDYLKEYNVKSFWELPKEVIADREINFLREVTPMMIAELLQLSAKHDVIICEGDIDFGAVASIASHSIYLCAKSDAFDWFGRPDHDDVKEELEQRTDLTEEEKQAIIDNAYAAVSDNDDFVPGWVEVFGVPIVHWNDYTGIEKTTEEVANIFGF